MKSSDAWSLSASPSEDADPESGVASPEADLAGALHEVSNALTVVLGWLDVAHQRLPPGADRDAIEVARTHARLGHRVARQAIGAEVFPGGTSERAARSLARCAIVGVTPQAQHKDLKLKLLEPEPCNVLIRDVGAALQILTNLLLNAIAFSDVGGRIVLELRAEDGFVSFSVTDCGPGIDPERAQTLLTKPESTRSGGAGIGLRHCTLLARAKRGELSLSRWSPHATFELKWPIAEARSSTQRPIVKRAPSLKGARILVVEDDAAVRSLIELGLEARGAQAVVVASREEFEMVTLRRPVFDAALIDLSPIQDDVRGALERLRLASPAVSVVLISGAATGVPDDVADEFVAWVRKPFEVGEVVSALAQVLGRRSDGEES